MWALCGSGFAWNGDGALVANSAFAFNGDPYALNNTAVWKQNMVSDGLTMGQTVGSTIRNCVFQDNSDVNLILGGGVQTTVQSNTFFMRQSACGAGIMADNFGGSTQGNFTGFVVSDNTVDCGEGRCHYGIEVGPLPYYVSPNVFGGTVSGNSVTGAGILINVDGGGTTASPVVVVDNTLGTFVPNLVFSCGKACPGSVFNIAPGSVVDRQGETSPPATNFEWKQCS